MTGCATVDSEPRIVTVCPPVVEYSREFQARTTEELVLLPERSSIAEMEDMVATLTTLADACAGDHRPDCPILGDFEQASPEHRPAPARAPLASSRPSV